MELVGNRRTRHERLDATFAALADPTRRAILARLASGQATVTELAEPFAMTQPAISKHLKVLERAGLISRGRDAQRRPCRLEAKRLAAALTRAQSRIAKNQVTLESDNKIFIKDGERCWFVALTDISLFESEGNYARVYFQTDAGPHRPLILRSLNQLEARLDAAIFFRANRRQIINLDFVKRVEPADTGGLSVVLKNDLIIGLSRRRAMEFRAMSSL